MTIVESVAVTAMTDITARNGPIFIVGAPRSGTTLLQFMMRAHPRISMPTGESHFFIPLLRDPNRWDDLTKLENIRAVIDAMYRQSAEFLDTDLHGLIFSASEMAKELHEERCFSIPLIIARIFEKNAAGEGKVRWADKTPYYVLHMLRLKKIFNNAQFIHLIRDGRDVAQSMFGRQHDFRIYNTYLAAKYWQQYVDVGCEQGKLLGPESYHEIRYEDLIVNPETTLKNMCTFLGEDFSEELLHYKKAKMAGKTPLLSQPLKSNNAEKWRTVMSARQVSHFESAAGNTLAACGYQLDSKARSMSLFLRAACRLHNLVIRKWYKLFVPLGR